MKCVFSFSFNRNFEVLSYVIRPVVHLYMHRAITISRTKSVYLLKPQLRLSASYTSHHQAV